MKYPIYERYEIREPWWNRIQLWQVGCVAVVLLVVAISMMGAAHQDNTLSQPATYSSVIIQDKEQ